MRKLVFVHGWATNNDVWQGVEHDLCNTVTVELPSHGKLSGTWDEPTLAPAVDAIVRNAGKEPFIGIGWSLGASALIKAAADKKISPDALVLVSSTPHFTASEEFPHGQSPSLVRRMLMDMTDSPEDTLKRFYKLNFTEDDLTLGRDVRVKSFLDKCEGYVPELDHKGVTTALKALGNADLRDDVKKLDVPTLIIHGSLDNVVPLEASNYMHENIKGSTRLIFEGTGHAPFITDRENFIASIWSFISGL